MAAVVRTRVKSDPLDRVRLTDSERAVAQASLEQGERIADVIVGAIAAISSVMQRTERALRGQTKYMN